MIYHHAIVSISVLSVSWQFCCISGYCAPCRAADVEDMDQELFVSLFLISILNTLVQVSVSVFWVILSKPNSVINKTVVHRRENKFWVIEWESSVTRVTLMQALSPDI